MSIYTQIVSNVLFPLHEKLKRHDTVRVKQSLEKTQWLSSKKIEKLQIERLRELLINAGKYVPYYRVLFEKIHFNPTSINSTTDLQKLPFLSKTIIRENLESLKSERAIGLTRFNTGGSSGQPLIFFIGKERVSHDVAAKWRATRWWDVDIGDKEIVVWGSPIELGAQDRIRLLRDKFIRTKLIPAFEMSEKNLDRFIGEIKNFKPTMLFGYPSSLSLIANHAEKTKQNMNTIGIKVVFVTSERLYDHQRNMIERVFGCSVANGYGGRDAGFIAHQCPSGGMHITAEDIIVEIVDTAGNVLPAGQVGEIVVTHLSTKDFPFVRYKTGDVAVLDDRLCSCGRGLPMLKEIQGRTTDFVVATDGTVLHGLSLIYILRDIPGIENFKIIQESLDHTRVLLATNANFDESSIDTIRRGIQSRLGQLVKVDIERVNEVEREASGKYRYIVSHVNPA